MKACLLFFLLASFVAVQSFSMECGCKRKKFLDRIVATRVPGVAFDNAAQSEGAPFTGAVFFDGLKRVL